MLVAFSVPVKHQDQDTANALHAAVFYLIVKSRSCECSPYGCLLSHQSYEELRRAARDYLLSNQSSKELRRRVALGYLSNQSFEELRRVALVYLVRS